MINTLYQIEPACSIVPDYIARPNTKPSRESSVFSGVRRPDGGGGEPP